MERGEEELPACLRNRLRGGEREDIGFSSYTKLCKARFLSTKWSAVTTFILLYVINPFFHSSLGNRDRLEGSMLLGISNTWVNLA